MTTVRRAEASDARAIAEVQVETWRAAYVGVMPQATLDALDVDERAQAWERWVRAERTAQFVAERSGQTIGFASAGPCGHEQGSGEVYAIYVRPDAWSTGAGRQLMDEAVAWLAERWPQAVLWVAEENPRARRFYERYGWVAETTRVEEVAPGAHVPEVLYRLTFARA
ncbi:MAG TPA: GNAT family N-acetyltransferase [Gaiellaceae bacterium]|nr:GNAT family N-acetyltransferase [Gaiellaceae bacterium]